MSSAPLADRLVDSYRRLLTETSPELPTEIMQSRASRYASRTVQELQGYVSELEADAYASNDYPLSKALGDLFQRLQS